jgi:hypothetical protein
VSAKDQAKETILLKPKNASLGLSMNGNFSMLSSLIPFVLSAVEGLLQGFSAESEAAHIALSSSLLAGRFSKLERQSYESNVGGKGSLDTIAQKD